MSRPITSVVTYQQFTAHLSLKNRGRSLMRDGALFAFSLMRSIPRGLNWIQFPYYHHVFDDERNGFDEHLKYMKNFGDFISLDDAVDVLESNRPIDCRYFCITFDDGFKSCITNAMPILLKYKVPATFFIPTKYIGSSVDRDSELCSGFYEGEKIMMEFLSWEDCRKMAQEGMSFGSHSVSHIRLINLSEEDVERELKDSKSIIECELGQPCVNFCPPVGHPGVDFLVDRDIKIAKRLGYRSFATGRRGSVRRRQAPMQIDRHHIIAVWPTYQLRYFFSR